VWTLQGSSLLNIAPVVIVDYNQPVANGVQVVGGTFSGTVAAGAATSTPEPSGTSAGGAAARDVPAADGTPAEGTPADTHHHEVLHHKISVEGTYDADGNCICETTTEKSTVTRTTKYEPGADGMMGQDGTMQTVPGGVTNTVTHTKSTETHSHTEVKTESTVTSQSVTNSDVQQGQGGGGGGGASQQAAGSQPASYQVQADFQATASQPAAGQPAAGQPGPTISR